MNISSRLNKLITTYVLFFLTLLSAFHANAIPTGFDETDIWNVSITGVEDIIVTDAQDISATNSEDITSTDIRDFIAKVTRRTPVRSNSWIDTGMVFDPEVARGDNYLLDEDLNRSDGNASFDKGNNSGAFLSDNTSQLFRLEIAQSALGGATANYFAGLAGSGKKMISDYWEVTSTPAIVTRAPKNDWSASQRTKSDTSYFLFFLLIGAWILVLIGIVMRFL